MHTSRTPIEFALSRLRHGTLVIVEPNGARRAYGSGAPTATVSVHDPRVWRMALGGSLGLADAYADGLWDSPDLPSLIRLAARNAAPADRLRARFRPLLGAVQWARAIRRPSSDRQRRKDIAAHYDLGNELFKRMLDPTMTYSCAVFEDAQDTLEEAQTSKLELVCRKLELGPRDRVLEIGSGWGSFAVHAARTRGCHVTTTTISAEQHAYVSELVQRAELADRVKVLASDFRDLRGRYDKLVSIEMIEAVGWRHTGMFLRRCESLLEPQGAMLLQVITIDDRAYETDKGSRSFIKERIFPGGSLPSIKSLASDLARHTDLQLVHLQDLTAHYVLTLKRWRDRFCAHAKELAELGYDERFRRLWTLYLAYCEAGFAERRIGDVQLVLANRESRLRWLREARDPVSRAPEESAPLLASA